MKNLILTITIATLGFTACKSNDDSTKNIGREGLVQSSKDTSGFAAFKEEQAQKLQAADRLKADSLQILKDSIKEIHKDIATENTTEAKNSNESSSRAVASSSSSESSRTTTAKKKKGMSKATKGTIIGAGAGALTGALVTKHKRGIGALVGAAVGGGTGYVIGHSQDKKDQNK
ncbi:glycine zipper domain-containing protein [Rhizosphaericola mali]|uniref:Glycine zipper 2TM domain-containing protein n=1 Tax=Rhizosphaericola mali TaxID=2545455 RepID=A0A5P2FW98_9BACT|nr:glycine zipper domain-containing protein [Rhizosphaericola mali]QES87445.1 glycine zipper 2TM domain-containing protein [Rhizosphaericola mali]